jgi:DNA-binding transcriptional regulator LsrR (DeoR family)
MLFAKWRDNTDTSSAYAIQPLPDSLRGADSKWEEKYKTHWNVITGKARELDVAIVGIGSPEVGKGGGTFAQILKTHGVDPKKLKDKGMAGEICNRPFDSDGRDLMEVDDIILSFLDGVELGVLKELVDKKRKVIAVAGGANKTDAIRVALRKGLVNYLITDVHTGEELCDLA